MALLYGVTQFVTYIMNAALFLCAAVVVEKANVKQSDCFVAILSMIYAGKEAGNAAGWSPDIATAAAAVKRVFDYMDTPSEIDALQMDED